MSRSLVSAVLAGVVGQDQAAEETAAASLLQQVHTREQDVAQLQNDLVVSQAKLEVWEKKRLKLAVAFKLRAMQDTEGALKPLVDQSAALDHRTDVATARLEALQDELLASIDSFAKEACACATQDADFLDQASPMAVAGLRLDVEQNETVLQPMGPHVRQATGGDVEDAAAELETLRKRKASLLENTAVLEEEALAVEYSLAESMREKAQQVTGEVAADNLQLRADRTFMLFQSEALRFGDEDLLRPYSRDTCVAANPALSMKSNTAAWVAGNCVALQYVPSAGMCSLCNKQAAAASPAFTWYLCSDTWGVDCNSCCALVVTPDAASDLFNASCEALRSAAAHSPYPQDLFNCVFDCVRHHLASYASLKGQLREDITGLNWEYDHAQLLSDLRSDEHQARELLSLLRLLAATYGFVPEA
eukprot:gene3536-3987_t